MRKEMTMDEKNLTTFVPSTHGFHFRNGISMTPKFLRPIFDLKFGVCGGMCWATLDRYFDEEPTDSAATAPLPGSALYKELFWRQMDSTSSWRWFKTIVWQNTFDKKLAELTQKQEWPKVKKLIDEGTPITLCLIQCLPIIGIPTANHQVLAVGYRVDNTSPDKPIYISIYNPNWPDKDTATLYMTGEGSNAEWKTYVPNTDASKKLRGFFIIPHESKH
jgi:hypothetical protein